MPKREKTKEDIATTSTSASIIKNTNQEPQTQAQIPMPKTLFGFFHYLHDHIFFLNNSKFFAGVIMILLNIGSKFITIQFSKSVEEYLKLSITKQILVFAMAWMGTRDIYTALVLTSVFVILSDHLFNEESHYCIVPHQYRLLDKLPAAANTNTNQNANMILGKDDMVSEADIMQAEMILSKAKQQEQQRKQQELYKQFDVDIQKVM
jgi:hypothetical protein